MSSFRPAKSSDHLVVPFLDFLFAVVAFMDEHRRKKNYAGAVSSFAMRASCFCSWSSCRRSCSAPTVFSCWRASTPLRMPSSLVTTGSNFSSSFFSMVSPTASRMTFACSERSLSSFLSSLSSNLPNSAFNSALVTGAFALFGSFSIHRDLYLKCTYMPEPVTACEGELGISQESHDFCHVQAVAGSMSFGGQVGVLDGFTLSLFAN